MWFDEYDNNFKGQIFNDMGNRVGTEFQINTHTPDTGNLGYRDNPGITSLSDGGFFVTWSVNDASHGGQAFDVHGQFFEANGDKRGPEFQVNHQTIGDQFHPEAIEVDGGVLVTYATVLTLLVIQLVVIPGLILWLSLCPIQTLLPLLMDRHR